MATHNTEVRLMLGQLHKNDSTVTSTKDQVSKLKLLLDWQRTWTQQATILKGSFVSFRGTK